MANAYPELPIFPYTPTSVAMAEVVAYLQAATLLPSVKRSTYAVFRNESGNGKSGVNNNYCGAQADGTRWPAKWDAAIAGTVTTPENKSGQQRIFVAFRSWRDSVDFLADRLFDRGLYVGGTTHFVTHMEIKADADLARAYHKEWVTGNVNAEPTKAECDGFVSMLAQAKPLFPIVTDLKETQTMPDNTSPAAPAFHPDNALASPATSLLGAGVLLNSVVTTLAQGGMPTTPIGWVGLAANLLIGVGGILGRS